MMEERVDEAARSARYVAGERILVLMRKFLGDNQKKAEYIAQIKLLRNFIKDPSATLENERLEEINTDLASLGQGIDRESFLDEQLNTLLYPQVDLTSIEKQAIFTKLFSRLSLRELEKYAEASDAARRQVNEYYEFFFTQAKLSDNSVKLFRLIQSQNIAGLKVFLKSLAEEGLLSPGLFDPAGIFDPLLYLNIHGNQDALDLIYSAVGKSIPPCPDEITMKIRTGQPMSTTAKNTLWQWCEYPDESIESLFALACEYECREVVNLICQLYREFLLSAIKEGNLSKVKALVEQGANPATFPVDETRRYYLQMNFYELAIDLEQNEIAKYLIDQSMADILAKDGNHGRVFAVACRANNIEILRYLCDKTKGNPSVENIIKGGFEGFVYKKTALQHACLWGNVEAVGLLLEMGFPVGVIPNVPENVTALYFACMYINKNKATALEIIQLILAKNSTPEFINAGYLLGERALHLAYASGNRAVIELLLQKGAVFGSATLSTMWVLSDVVRNPDTRKTIPIDLLERYTEKNPQHKIAKRLFNVLTRVEGASPLTLGEKIYLGIAAFFNTELGFIYDMSRSFCPLENKTAETVPLLEEAISEPSDVPLPPRERTVREQLGFEDDVAYFDRKTPPPSPRSININNNNNTVDEETLRKTPSPITK